jgi:hypothetical protein
MSAGAAHDLPHIGLLELKELGDLGIAVLERLTQDVCGTLGGLQPRQHQRQGRCQGFGPLRSQLWIRTGVDGFGQPPSHAGLAAHTSGLHDVDGQPGRRAGQEGRRPDHREAVRPLPAQPDFLQHVLGFGHAAEYAIRKAEETRPVLHENGNGFFQVLCDMGRF